MRVSDVDKTECSIYVGFIFRCDREIPPMELIFGEVSEVVFEFLEAEPRVWLAWMYGWFGFVGGEEDVDMRMKREYKDSMGVFRGCGSVGIPIGFQVHLLSLLQTATCCRLWGSSPI